MLAHLAVVGAGPSGVFATAAAIEREGISVDVFDRLPTPFGLVRYGVAPDHSKIKSVTRVLAKTMSSERVRFFGNVDYGRDIRPGRLHEIYDAVLFATGAPQSRRLGIPGEHLAGNYVAADVVPWYNGHPQVGIDLDFDVCHGARSLAIVGAGNVTLDIARVILKGADGLGDTDIPPEIRPALDVLAAITEVHVVVRRGAADVKFTLPELQEFERMTEMGIDVLVAGCDLACQHDGTEDDARLNLFRRWAQRAPRPGTRRLIFHFGVTPIEIRGRGRVDGIVVRNTANVSAEPGVIAVHAVIQSIGYSGQPVAGVQFDYAAGLIPSDAGRVASRTYVAGWIKRGPVGVIGVNKACARETIRRLLVDLDAEPAETAGRQTARESFVSELRATGRVVDWQGWNRIDEAEVALGARHSCVRTKIRDHDRLVSIATAI